MSPPDFVEIDDATVDIIGGMDGRVHLHFPVPITCVNFDADQAEELALKILHVANELRPNRERKTGH